MIRTTTTGDAPETKADERPGLSWSRPPRVYKPLAFQRLIVALGGPGQKKRANCVALRRHALFHRFLGKGYIAKRLMSYPRHAATAHFAENFSRNFCPKPGPLGANQTAFSRNSSRFCEGISLLRRG